MNILWENDRLIQGVTKLRPVWNFILLPGFTRPHFPRFIFSVYAVEDTINLFSNQLKFKMYNTPVVVHTFRLFKSRHNNAVLRKGLPTHLVLHLWRVSPTFPLLNTIITKYIPLGVCRGVTRVQCTGAKPRNRLIGQDFI